MLNPTCDIQPCREIPAVECANCQRHVCDDHSSFVSRHDESFCRVCSGPYGDESEYTASCEVRDCKSRRPLDELIRGMCRSCWSEEAGQRGNARLLKDLIRGVCMVEEAGR